VLRGSAVFAWLLGLLLVVLLSAPEPLRLGLAVCRAPQMAAVEAEMAAAVLSYADSWNRRHPLGPRVSLTVETYLSNPIPALHDLRERDVRAVVGFSASDALVTALDSLPSDLPILTTSASSPLLSRGGDPLFRTRESLVSDNLVLAHLVRRLRGRNLLVLWSGGNSGVLLTVFDDVSREARVPLLGVLPYEEVRGDPATRERLRALYQPSILLLGGPPMPTLWALEAAREIWPGVPALLCPWSIFGMTGRLGAFPDLEFYTAEALPLDRMERSHPYAEDWRLRSGRSPSPEVIYAFLAMDRLLRACTSVPGIRGPELTRALAKQKDLSTPLGRFEVDARGDLHMPIRAYRCRGGRFEEVRP